VNAFAESDLLVAIDKLCQARKALEDNADAETPADSKTLREVYSLITSAHMAVAGALAVLRLEDEMTAALQGAPTERPARLRVIK